MIESTYWRQELRAEYTQEFRDVHMQRLLSEHGIQPADDVRIGLAVVTAARARRADPAAARRP